MKYRWSVSSGTIVEGQGTPILKVKVLPNDFYGKNHTATVEIAGLPKNCENAASETMSIAIDLSAKLSDKFSISASRIDKDKIETLVNELRENPTAQGYIIELFDSNVSKKAVEAKSQKILKYFTTIGFDKNRITLLNGLANLNDLPNKNLTQFFIVPAGATPPECVDCIEAQP